MGSNLCVSYFVWKFTLKLKITLKKPLKLNDQRLDKVEELINIQLYTFCFWL